MAIDFFKLLSPEAQERVLAHRERKAAQVAEVRNLSNEELVKRTEHYFKNSTTWEDLRRSTWPTYDVAIVQILIPEILRRLSGG